MRPDRPRPRYPKHTCKKHIAIQKTMHWLITEFPNCFMAKSVPPKPLKMGIKDDIIAHINKFETPPVSHNQLRNALRQYSRKNAYLRAHKEGSPRVDLKGNPVGVVSAVQSKMAKKIWYKRKNIENNKAKPKRNYGVPSVGFAAKTQNQPATIKFKKVLSLKKDNIKETST